METATTMVTCWKCGGRGVIKHLRHVDDGVCYQCEGSGECEPRKAPRRRPVRRDARHEMRTLYRAATRTQDPRGPLTYADVTDESGMGWTHAGLVTALDEVPGSREAFRALGWPV